MRKRVKKKTATNQIAIRNMLPCPSFIDKLQLKVKTNIYDYTVLSVVVSQWMKNINYEHL